jgi:hypothetical protein
MVKPWQAVLLAFLIIAVGGGLTAVAPGLAVLFLVVFAVAFFMRKR